ncbi:MAG: efflux RND transporter periplasmic adaptor subunit [Planctomycetaceae bacterium]|jgi:multidrug efflux pump subunit AcrA (membrane-fusion protein)|nr:efflux RND transporter periplasmic adaptor subunit [Planctomycetaceae bacterium]
MSSTDTNQEQALVEQTRQEIRVIVNEITQLSKMDIGTDEYHTEFLNRVVAAMGAVGGVIWTFNEGMLNAAYQINFKELKFQENQDANKRHARLLYRMLHGPETGTLVPAHSGIEGEEESGNPSDFFLVFAPIRTELEVVGLVEIIQRPDANTVAQRGFLRFLSQVCILATDYYKNRQLRNFGERQNLWTLLEDFTRTIHRSLDVNETGYTVVNEGRRLIECDRVSLALKKGGGKCRIIAVSGQDVIDKRATTVKLLGKLATAVVKAGEPIWYSGDTSDFAPQVEKAVENYVDEAHTKMIAVFPLVRKLNKPEEEDDPRKRSKPELPFGALLVEQIEDSRVPERMRKRVEIVAEHACSALGNAIEHRSIFLMPVWKTIGKTKVLFTARMLPKTLLVSAAVLAVIGILTFMPWRFQMYCNGTLEPVVRQKIYSPLDGEVEELYVDHNSAVKGPYTAENGDKYFGTTLLKLRSSQLENTGIELHGKRKEIVEQIASLQRQLLDQDKRLTEVDKSDLDGRLKQAKIQLASNEEQYKIYLRQVQDLHITAPFDGAVVSWDVKQRLTQKRPISRMQYVMEVAYLDGAWQLELAMPERRMGNIAKYQKLLKDGEKLKVEFVLATDPSITYYGMVREIYGRAEVRTDTGSAGSASSSLNTVLMKVALDDPDKLPENLRPGAECSARVYCGTKPVGYVLFYEVIAFVQKNILFRLSW